ncbi:hypothetical protein L9F63_010415, partial [Diploptera punctata]
MIARGPITSKGSNSSNAAVIFYRSYIFFYKYLYFQFHFKTTFSFSKESRQLSCNLPDSTIACLTNFTRAPCQLKRKSENFAIFSKED